MSKRKPKPCPSCGSTNLDIGDCGYFTFNVAWVKCKKCKLELKLHYGDDAVPTWNKWAANPIKELMKQVKKQAKQQRHKDDHPKSWTMKEFAVKEIQRLMKNTQ